MNRDRQAFTDKTRAFTTKARVCPEFKLDFIKWQSKLNAMIAAFPGFVSLEILALTEKKSCLWTIIQTFLDGEALLAWKESEARKELLKELKAMLIDDKSEAIQETELETIRQGGVTEVFVTQVNPEKENNYREWLAKIHQVEAQFPGFRGMYVQSPQQGGGRNWITFLHFDTSEHLDYWLASPERHAVLVESEPLINSLDSHRLISPYAGWFSSAATNEQAPSVWKQTMLVLLVLFPIVMLELKFLSPLTAGLNASVATFIGNAISVSLIAWPMMPIAIWLLKWWLFPKKNRQSRITCLGTFVVFGLYCLEIFIFWNLL